jgi:ABC-type lipoprotein export system ATPase subunit
MLILQELNERGITVALVTHDMATAEHAGRVIELKDGKVLDVRVIKKPKRACDELEEMPPELIEEDEAVAETGQGAGEHP